MPNTRLTIVIPYQDLYQHELNLAELEQFLRHMCRYTDYKSPSAAGAGRAIS